MRASAGASLCCVIPPHRARPPLTFSPARLCAPARSRCAVDETPRRQRMPAAAPLPRSCDMHQERPKEPPGARQVDMASCCTILYHSAAQSCSPPAHGFVGCVAQRAVTGGQPHPPGPVPATICCNMQRHPHIIIVRRVSAGLLPKAPLLERQSSPPPIRHDDPVELICRTCVPDPRCPSQVPA